MHVVGASGTDWGREITGGSIKKMNLLILLILVIFDSSAFDVYFCILF